MCIFGSENGCEARVGGRGGRLFGRAASNLLLIMDSVTFTNLPESTKSNQVFPMQEANQRSLLATLTVGIVEGLVVASPAMSHAVRSQIDHSHSYTFILKPRIMQMVEAAETQCRFGEAVGRRP